MLIGNDLFNQTRRRFKHIEDTAQERQLVESKQRKYKKILDDQINEKRKMQHPHNRPMHGGRARFSYAPESKFTDKMIPKTPKYFQEPQDSEIKNGHSRFITDTRQIETSIDKGDDDEQVNNYLQECQKILNYLRDLSKDSKKATPTHKKVNRKFIKLNRSRHLLSNQEAEDIEERYNREYQGKFPQISPANRQSQHRRENLAILLNPTLFTKSHQNISPQQTSRYRKKNYDTEQNQKIKIQGQKTKRSHSRNATVDNIIPKSLQNQQNPQFFQSEKGKKSKLEINKEKLLAFAKNTDLSTEEQLTSPQNKEPAKPNHLIRIKAHGYKLFEKLNKKTRTVHTEPNAMEAYEEGGQL